MMERDPEDLIGRRELDDGRQTAIEALLFGARICIGPVDAEDWEDFWDYDSLVAAIAAYDTWNPLGGAEPEGWIRHAPTGRRRKNGDPATEVIRP